MSFESSSPSQPEPGQMKAFRNSAHLVQWVFLIFAAIGCAAYLTHLRFLGGDSVGKTASLAVAEAIGGAFVLLGIPTLVSLLFKIASRFAVRLVGLTLMVFLNWLAVKDQAKPAADFVSETAKHRTEWKRDVADQLANRGAYEVDLPKAEKAMDAIREKTQRFDGKPKVMADALFKVNDQLLVLAKAYEAQHKRFNDSGGADASNIRTLEDLTNREAVIGSFGNANNDIVVFLKNIDTHLNTAFGSMELTPDQREEAIQNYKRGAKLDTVLAIRGINQQVAADSIVLMHLLRREWGKWRMQSGAVIFDRAGAADEFNAILVKINTARDRQAELQRRFVK